MNERYSHNPRSFTVGGGDTRSRCVGCKRRQRRWLTITHSQRLHAHRHTAGDGHIYQGRFKSFPIEQDEALFTVLRYVERNALRANLVGRAEEWRWCNLWRRLNGDRESLLSRWPVDTPTNWVDRVNAAQTAAELEALRNSVNRGTPYGSAG
jgi:putative transposase